MENKTNIRKAKASREEWLNAAILVLNESGVNGIKIVPLARRLELTSGSFYWHFKNIHELLDSVLDYWEFHLTDHIVRDAQEFNGTADDRILNLMLQVIREDAAISDHAISVWAKSNSKAQLTFKRTVNKRFIFAQWMFEQAGFSETKARARGRMMVTSLMGEASNGLKLTENWEETITSQWRVLINR